ncbi:hypothetical protein ANCDUO_08903, partial [Ancylostoma duodenale]
LARGAEELLIDRKHEAIFIDRDPKHFPEILKYLREGKLRYSACGREIEGIREDAELRFEEAHRGPFFVGERVVWSNRLSIELSGMDEHCCSWCHLTRSVLENNCIFDFPHSHTHCVGTIAKVGGVHPLLSCTTNGCCKATTDLPL